MIDTKGTIGITDNGEPVVLPGCSCELWRIGVNALMESRTCWYCKYADFRKTSDIVLEQSIYRCEKNKMSILDGNKNEQLERMMTK